MTDPARPSGQAAPPEDRAACQQRITALMIAISVRSVPEVVRSLVEARLTMQQLNALTAIVVEEDVTTSGLAERFGVSKAAASKLVDRLVDQQLVERADDPTDHRVRRLRATTEGHDVVGDLARAHSEQDDGVLAGLSLAELAALETGLRAIDRELLRLAQAGRPRPGAGRQTPPRPPGPGPVTGRRPGGRRWP